MWRVVVGLPLGGVRATRRAAQPGETENDLFKRLQRISLRNFVPLSEKPCPKMRRHYGDSWPTDISVPAHFANI